MYRIKNINLVGQRFGRLTVLEAAGKNHKRCRLWKCKCDCDDKIVEVVTWRLRNGNTKSCGCLHTESILDRIQRPSGEAACVQLYYRYRHEADKRGLIFELTKEQFAEMTKKDCFYCSRKPGQVIQAKRCNGSYTYNGIDRLNSSKDYTTDNCVPCCKRCNFMKMEMTVEEFVTACRSIVNHFDQKQ